MKHLLTFFFCLLSALPCWGLPESVTIETVEKLSRDRTWHKMMKYRPNTIGSGVSSQIVSPDYFLAPDGKQDPNAELSATLTAFFNPIPARPDEHARCRFPARYIWLNRQLNLDALNPPSPNCDLYRRFTFDNRFKSISLMMVSGYFDNPASFYGHLLLNLNVPATDGYTALMNRTLNYGAKVPENEHPLRFLVYGLFGGYKASYSDQHFFVFNFYYTERDLRDLWEYELNLSEAQTELLVAHAWEMMGQEFKYYFLDKNCAYWIADFVELVLPNDTLITEDYLYTMPSSIFDKAMVATNNGEPLVKRVTFIPSRQHRFYSKYASLATHLQREVRTVIGNKKDNIDIKRLTPTLPPMDKAKVVDTALDYTTYSLVKTKDSASLKRAKQQLLLTRLSLKNQDPKWPTETAIPVHKGQYPSQLRYGFGTGPKGGVPIIGYQAAYYDLLSTQTGRLAHSEIRMADFGAHIEDGQLLLDEVTIVHLETLNISQTGLPRDGSKAWKIKIGWEDEDLKCVDCKVFHITGGIGKAMTLIDDTVGYVFIDGRAQTDGHYEDRLFAEPRLGMIYNPFNWAKFRVELGYRVGFDNDEYREWHPKIEARFLDRQDMDIRVKYEYLLEPLYQAGITQYF